MLGLFDQQSEQHQPQFLAGEHLAATATTEAIAPAPAETTAAAEGAAEATPETFAIGAIEAAAEATGKAFREALAEAAFHHHMHHAGGATVSFAVALCMAFMPFTVAAATSVKMPHHSFSCESCHEEKIRLTHDLSRYILKDF
jgi:uncharacterized lipoprotein YbaY